MLLPGVTRRKAVNTFTTTPLTAWLRSASAADRPQIPLRTMDGVTSHPASQGLFDRARAVSPGGVNSPVRAFRAVGGTPIFMRSGSGAWLTDVDGNRYVDLVGSWGP